MIEKIPDEALPEDLLFLGYAGSLAHGTHRPKSDPDSIDDVDLIGVYAETPCFYLGFGGRDVKEYKEGEWDVVSYELRKLVGLLLKQNPNVMGLLWLSADRVLVAEEEWRVLLDHRGLFVSKRAYFSFAGYARGQFRRMTHYADNNPQRQAEIDTLNAEMMHRSALTRQRGPGNYAREPYRDWSMQKLRARYNDLRGASGYMGEKRKALVERFGYDCKNASHLIRLLRMCLEFLPDGELRVDRSGIDADELVAIKRGEWTLEEVNAEAEALFASCESAYARSPLPEKPDREGAEELLVSLLRRRMGTVDRS